MQGYCGTLRQEGGGPLLSFGGRTLRGLPSGETGKRIASARYVGPIGNIAQELRGFVEGADGFRTPIHADISEPKVRVGHGYYYSVIHCPYLFEDDKRIAGVDADQALELSIMFVKMLLDHAGVVLVEEEPSEPSR